MVFFRCGVVCMKKFAIIMRHLSIFCGSAILFFFTIAGIAHWFNNPELTIMQVFLVHADKYIIGFFLVFSGSIFTQLAKYK